MNVCMVFAKTHFVHVPVPDQGCAGPVAYYYPRGPFAADLQHLPLQRVQLREPVRGKDKLSSQGLKEDGNFNRLIIFVNY